mgnify:CR=1 FL=1
MRVLVLVILGLAFSTTHGAAQALLDARPSDRSVEDRMTEPGLGRQVETSEMPPRLAAAVDEIVSLADTELEVTIRSDDRMSCPRLGSKGKPSTTT